MSEEIRNNKQQEDNKKLQAALGYAKNGWFVHPLCWPTENGECGCGRNPAHMEKKIGKAPITHHGEKDATTNPDIIREWWEKWPEANIGINLGLSKLVAIDTDSKEAEEEAKSWGLPTTRVHRTAKGHHHIYVNSGPDEERLDKKGKSRSIDVLSGGYIVAPPSRHRKGAQYKLVHDGLLANAPNWALEMLAKKKKPSQVEASTNCPTGRKDECLLTGHRTINEILTHFKGVKKTAPEQWMALCPAHDDEHPSLSIGLDGKHILLNCHAGCDTENIVRAIGVEMRDLFLDEPSVEHKQTKEVKPVSEDRVLKESEGHWDYQDERGKVLYLTVRYSQGNSKRFVAYRPHGSGQWLPDITGVRRVVYRLPELLAADPANPVYIPEGEKHVDKLIELGFVATCNPFGAGKWKDDYSQHLERRRVVILPDNDEPGRKHAQQVAESLRGLVASTKVLQLPGLPPKGDILDWLDAGHVADDLRTLINRPHRDTREALDKCIETVRKWLLLPDDSVIRYLLALVIANRLPGDPVWGFVIAPSGGAKTELLNALTDIPEIYPISDLTPQTFISGLMKNKKASLLLRLERGTILTLKDFTTVLQLPRDSRQQILSQLREIADGSYIKEFGTGERISWEGKLGFIAGVTPIIDKHRSVYAVLGERFLQLRTVLPPRKDLAKAARQDSGKEEEMRGELRKAMADCIAGVDLGTIPEWPEDLGSALDNLATLCAIARSGVVRSGGYSKELQMILEPEVPTRLVKQFVKLGQASAILRGADKVETEDYDLIKKVALDTILATRWKILRVLLAEPNLVTTLTVATRIGLPKTTTERYLQDLEGLGLVVGDKPGVGKANRWGVSVLLSDLVAKSLTSPHKSPHEEMEEYKDDRERPKGSLLTFVGGLEDAVSDKDSQPNHNVKASSYLGDCNEKE